ncbi:MAG TPA: hypothetical protein PKN44_12155 [Bacteroidales bacterium]|nr:hypothetical protein [Bacteroidales bacterium]
MKRYLTIFLAFLAGSLAAQNYQNICSPGVSFYQEGLLYQWGAFGRDSVVVMPNNDTVFYSYKVLHDTNTMCLDYANGSFLGRKVYQSVQTGNFMFFNKYGDTILVCTQAALNQTWHLMNLQGGDYIEAKVTRIGLDSVLGTVDMTKEITLQTKDASGNNIVGNINGSVIWLTRHYGFSTFFDVYSIPDWPVYVRLLGKENPPAGIQYATGSQLFDFSIGDEFHYHGFMKNYNFDAGLTDWHDIKTILQKEVFADSIVYHSLRCRRQTSTEVPHYVSFRDTVRDAYYPARPFFNCRPGELVPDPVYGAGVPWPACYAGCNIKNRLTKGYTYGRFWISPGCITGMPSNNIDEKHEFTDGLGDTWDNIQYSGWSTYQWHNELVYFRKGAEVWGIPVATDCNTLVDAGASLNHVEKAFQVRLNPAATLITVTRTTDDTDPWEVELIGMFGTRVRSEQAATGSNEVTLDGLALPHGLYLVLILENNQMLSIKKLLLY